MALHVLGGAFFIFIVPKRLLPLIRAQQDPRFDRPLVRLGRVLKFWLGQWKHPRYKFAGTLHILIFAGFILLALRAFSVLIVGVSESFVMPGLSGRTGVIYDVITDYAATVVFLCMVVAAVRRLIFRPARYAVPAKYGKGHTADAIFLLGLIALLMVADSLFAASRAAGHAQQGQPVETLAVLSLPWALQIFVGSMPLATLWSLNVGAIGSSPAVGGVTPSYSILAASKTALNHLIRELSIKLGPHVRVNGIAPALVPFV